MADDKVQEFLNRIAMIESAGGKNTNHPEIQSGMHKGQHAIGTYGLMPKTIDELASNASNPELQALKSLSDDEKAIYLQKNPDLEKALAKQLAQKVLTNQSGDEEKAAYSWLHGHNLTPDKIQAKDYKNEPYVQKYDKLLTQPIREPASTPMTPEYASSNPTVALNNEQRTMLGSQLAGLGVSSPQGLPMNSTPQVNGYTDIKNKKISLSNSQVEDPTLPLVPKLPDVPVKNEMPRFGAINNLIASYLRKK